MLTITDQSLADFLWQLAGDLEEVKTITLVDKTRLDFVRGALYGLAQGGADGEALEEHSLPRNAGSTPARSTAYQGTRHGAELARQVAPADTP